MGFIECYWKEVTAMEAFTIIKVSAEGLLGALRPKMSKEVENGEGT